MGGNKTLNPLTDTPTSKQQITKSFMEAYMSCAKSTKEDLIWYQGIVNDKKYQKETINRLTGEPYLDIDIPAVRDLFCKRFYPNIGKKKNKLSFIERINQIKKD